MTTSARRRPTVPAVLWLVLLIGWMPLGAVALDPDRPSAVTLALYVGLLLLAMFVTFLRGAGHGLRRDPAGAARSLGVGSAALAAGAVLALPLRSSSWMPVRDMALAVLGGAAASALLLAIGLAAGLAWNRLARRVVRAGGLPPLSLPPPGPAEPPGQQAPPEPPGPGDPGGRVDDVPHR